MNGVLDHRNRNSKAFEERARTGVSNRFVAGRHSQNFSGSGAREARKTLKPHTKSTP